MATNPDVVPRRTGWCNVDIPLGHVSHARCQGGSDANPSGIWRPCPCSCHVQPVAPPPATNPTTAVAGLADATAALNRTMGGYDEPWVDALALLCSLRAVTADLAKIDALLVRHLYLHGEHGKRLVDGIGEVWIGRGRAKERWAGPEAITEYVDRRMVATGGEMPDPAQVIEWVLEVLPASPSTSLRVTPLREVGIEVEDYRASEPGTLKVDLPRPT